MLYDDAVGATLVAIRDRVARPSVPLALEPDERLDGVHALVTGATGGLGGAVVRQLAARGARVTCSARSSARPLVRAIEARGGAARDLPVDLADLRSIDRLVDAVEPLSLLVLCAGIVPGRSRATAKGFDVTVGVNYLANAHLVRRLRSASKLVDGRIVVVSSESHRGRDAVDLDGLADAPAYGPGGVMRRYGYSKLLLTAWAQDLARRLAPRVEVMTICPGPVHSRIAREAPGFARPILEPLMRTFFASPTIAAQPIVYLAAARPPKVPSGAYFHRWRAKPPSPLARDEAVARRLHDVTIELLERSAP